MHISTNTVCYLPRHSCDMRGLGACSTNMHMCEHMCVVDDENEETESENEVEGASREESHEKTPIKAQAMPGEHGQPVLPRHQSAADASVDG